MTLTELAKRLRDEVEKEAELGEIMRAVRLEKLATEAADRLDAIEKAWRDWVAAPIPTKRWMEAETALRRAIEGERA